MKNNIYLYGIIKADSSPVSLDSAGIGRDLTHISEGGVTAVTDRAPLVDYKSLPKDRVAQDLVAHQQILEEILKQTTVIPAKFGTFLEDEDEVKALLESFYHKLKEALEKFAGRIELDLVATWDQEVIFKNLYQEDRGLRQLQVKVAGATDPKSKIDLKVQLGKKVAEALEKRKKKYLPLIITGLKKCSEDICHHDLMDETMILNSSFLLPREQEKDFERTVEELDKNLNSELKFRIIGPLPPYSFATLEIRKIGTQELKKAGELLGLEEDVSLKEIKTSFRRMATQSHPDHQPVESAGRSEAEKRFGRINEAYQLLSDYHESGGESNLVVKVSRLDRVI